MTREELLRDEFETLSTSTLVWIYNDMCDENNDYDNRIESLDDLDFNDIWSGKTPKELLEIFNNRDFNVYDDYYKFNGYGNPYSLTETDVQNEVDYEELVQFIIDNDKYDEYDFNFDEENYYDEFKKYSEEKGVIIPYKTFNEMYEKEDCIKCDWDDMISELIEYIGSDKED